MKPRTINILVADGSSVSSIFLTHLLETVPGMCVVGTVSDGMQALHFMERWAKKMDAPGAVGVLMRPHVILLDLQLPGPGGLATTRAIMETHAIPIVICSATGMGNGTSLAFKALEAGAIACIEKPVYRGDPAFDAKVTQLLQTVQLMSEVKVVRRRATNGVAQPRPMMSVGTPADQGVRRIRAVGIGASTGGPPVLQTILQGLSPDFAAPVLVVQHIAPGFLAGMVNWLEETSGLPVHIASFGVVPLPGHVYLAPDEVHMGLGRDGRLVLSREKTDNQIRPAVSFLFSSLAVTLGANAIGVLLTGMGRDGAQELKTMRELGATTIAQDKASSVVHGMPGVAIAIGAATRVLPASGIAKALVELVNTRY